MIHSMCPSAKSERATHWNDARTAYVLRLRPFSMSMDLPSGDIWAALCRLALSLEYALHVHWQCAIDSRKCPLVPVIVCCSIDLYNVHLHLRKRVGWLVMLGGQREVRTLSISYWQLLRVPKIILKILGSHLGTFPLLSSCSSVWSDARPNQCYLEVATDLFAKASSSVQNQVQNTVKLCIDLETRSGTWQSQ